MVNILCSGCKNAFLQLKDNEYTCSSCGATHSIEDENLLLGIHFYNEGNYAECDDYLMKYIVKNGAEPRAIFYKALCDGFSFDEDTTSLSDTYSKLAEALRDIDAKDFPHYLALANDEAEKLELALAEVHVRLFADADAEKIKKQVSVILGLQKEAHEFRKTLTELTDNFNENNEITLVTKFSDCFLVDIPIATEVGNAKYRKICDNIASHTVFTGILSTDIKNLEIYYRCIVMFFQKSHDKYEFLLAESAKFTTLAAVLEEGRYNTIKGVGQVADKLKNISYDFLQESYKEHFDEQIDMQTCTVLIVEPEITETPEEEVLEEISSASTPGDEAVAETAEEVSEETETSEEADATDESTDVIETEESDEPVEEADENAEEVTEPETVTEETIAETEEQEAVTETAETEDEIPDDATEEDSSETDDVTEESPAISVPVSDVTSEISLEEISAAPIKSLADVLAEDVTQDAEKPTTESEVEETTVAPEVQLTENETIVIETVEADEASEEAPIAEEAEEKPARPKKKKSHKGVALFILVIIAAIAFAGFKYGPGLLNEYNYNKACEFAAAGNYDSAVDAFTQLGDYSDSAQKATETLYKKATELEAEGAFAEANLIYENLGSYMDSKTRATACTYGEAKKALEEKNFDRAIKLFESIKDYGDSATMLKECSYIKGTTLIENKEYEAAIKILSTIKKYSDSGEKINEAKYLYVTENFDAKNKTTVKYLDALTKADYRNSKDLRKELLGSSTVLSGKINMFVNYSTGDLETSLTELDNTRTIYCHVVVNDKDLYGKSLTLKYTTAFGYSQRETKVFTAENNSATMLYPSTVHKNYTVTFDLLSVDGTVLSSQTITF